MLLPRHEARRQQLNFRSPQLSSLGTETPVSGAGSAGWRYGHTVTHTGRLRQGDL